MHMPRLTRPPGKEAGRVDEQPQVYCKIPSSKQYYFAHRGPFLRQVLTGVTGGLSRKKRNRDSPYFLPLDLFSVNDQALHYGPSTEEIFCLELRNDQKKPLFLERAMVLSWWLPRI